MYPCLNLMVGARVTVQMKDEAVALEPADTGSLRGEELFRGQISWKWDASPETVFRYSAVIPGLKIQDNEALYRIIDYLIIVPKPGVGGADEIAAAAALAWETTERGNPTEVLDGYTDEFSYFIHTSWNVGRAG